MFRDNLTRIWHKFVSACLFSFAILSYSTSCVASSRIYLDFFDNDSDDSTEMAKVLAIGIIDSAGANGPGNFVPIAGTRTTFLVNAVGFAMISVPAKSFLTGTNDSGSTTVANSYQISETEVTYELWSEIYIWAISNGYNFANAGTKGTGGGGSNQQPVTTINWRDAMVWMNALTEYYNLLNGTSLEPVYYKDGDGSYATLHRDARDVVCGSSVQMAAGSCDNPDVKANADGFRLPTSIEWELAARYIADSNEDGDVRDSGEYYPGSFASGATASYSNSAATNAVSVNRNNAGSSTAVVKTKSPNALGLYDMSGNVFEWIFDWSSIGSYRERRGGSWSDLSNGYLQVGTSFHSYPFIGLDNGGLRVVRTL